MYKTKSFTLLLLFYVFAGCTQEHKPPPDTRQVYLCKSPTAYSYHFTKDCPGLQKCKHTIIKSDVVTAKKQGRTFCGWEANDTQ
ncbi:MAG: hypothetical protein V4581_16145, partial [Bacteroidota bacterium]